MGVSGRIPAGEAEFGQKLEAAWREIGANIDELARRDLPVFQDATELVLAHVSRSGREHFLIPDAAAQWQRMREAASDDAIELVMISGFRSFERQLQIVKDKLSGGQQLDQILEVLAPPGCSEHHTGRAADVGTPGCEPLSEEFEETAAFQWLRSNAKGFGFRMSYPRGNPMGFRYEPWHWFFRSR
jgi:D-alanyl-D-alanine carboxypeptidase